MCIDDELSPSMQKIVVMQGTRLRGFRKARASLADNGHVLTAKRVERETERCGAVRVRLRDAKVAKYRTLTLRQRCRRPAGVEVPAVVSVGTDGGCLQTVDASDKGVHWHKYRMADLRQLDSRLLTADPQPDLPKVFQMEARMTKLVSQISHKIAGTVAPDDPADAERDHAADSREADAILEPPVEPHASAADHPAAIPAAPAGVSEPSAPDSPEEDAQTRRINLPKTVAREVLASRKACPEFAWIMAAAAWSLGFFKARRKGFVGDGEAANWTIWEKHFKPHGFIPILDFIHALTYVYNAAMAGRTPLEGWQAYLRWITLVWQGGVATVIADLEARREELGAPLKEDAKTHPRKVVAASLTYLTHQQSRMDYPAYRMKGLAITSCHVESTVKQLNHRVKGSEMFWTDKGAEALLQLSADLLSDSRPLDHHWERQASEMTGYHRSAKSVL